MKGKMYPSGRSFDEISEQAQREFYEANGYHPTEEDCIRLTEEARAEIALERENHEKQNIHSGLINRGISDILMQNLYDFCKNYDKEEIEGIWLLNERAVGGEPRLVIKTRYQENSLEFLEIEGNISKFFSLEAKRNAMGGDYVGGIALYDYKSEFVKNPVEGRAKELMEEFNSDTTINLYTAVQKSKNLFS
jgi:hypothetical protein